MTFPVSIKGVVIHAGKVLLYEWELHVFIATYGCHATATPEPVVSDEHVTAHLFSDRESRP